MMKVIQRFKFPIIFTILFLALTCMVVNGMFNGIDNNIDNWSRSISNPALSLIFTFITNLGSFYSIMAITLFILWLARRIGISSRLQYSIVLSSLGSFMINYVIKNIIQRPRPPLPHLVQATGFSFPSSHAMVSMCFYAMVAFILSRIILKRRLAMIATMYTLIFLIAASRVILHVHYFSDIVSGLVAGFSLFLFLKALYKTSTIN